MKNIITALLLSLATTTTVFAPTEATQTHVYVMNGFYHDYEVVETVDGNVWEINRTFSEGELLQLAFSDNGTPDNVTDDITLSIRSIDRRYNLKKETKVVYLDHAIDKVVCADYTGNGYSFDGIEDWQVGDICNITLDKQGNITETIYSR